MNQTTPSKERTSGVKHVIGKVISAKNCQSLIVTDFKIRNLFNTKPVMSVTKGVGGKGLRC